MTVYEPIFVREKAGILQIDNVRPTACVCAGGLAVWLVIAPAGWRTAVDPANEYISLAGFGFGRTGGG
jgi:hypothetical protein